MNAPAIVNVPPRTRVLSWECFERRYQPIEDDGGCPLLDYWAPAARRAHPRQLWTVVDCDGTLYVVPGAATVNYFARIVTARGWSDTEETNPGYRY